ncbi:thioesterase II family protein [Lysobacter enzymogenes]|uniref:thioesterase II family protein n=1 Tax=Lysobacter enzymogenes TaxID=69 RepID=UPI001A95A33B|nr:thioesterase [Lysobacter enzymogenes]QQP95869.1 thioesterase [Lysobacter enzymogenes]
MSAASAAVGRSQTSGWIVGRTQAAGRTMDRPQATGWAVGAPQATAWGAERSPTSAPLTLFCFPYAGGNPLAYLPWQERLPSWIRIRAMQPPGRGQRLGEAPLQQWAPLIAGLTDAIAAEAAPRFAFFGHSLGALMAFETARECAARGLPLPTRLIVSGCAAPSRLDPEPGLHRLPEPALIARLRQYEGTPEAVLANAELVQLLLPTIRADLRLSEDYARAPRPAWTLPIDVLYGRSDSLVGMRMHGWAEETQGESTAQGFDGGHFFLDSRRDEVMAAIERLLA